MTTAIETSLRDDIVTLLRAASLKDGKIPVRTFVKGFDLTVLTLSKLPAVEIDIGDVTDENFTSDSQIGSLSYDLIAWVRGADSENSRNRARALIYDIRKAIRGDAALGASKGVIHFAFDLHDVDYKQVDATGIGMLISCTVTEATL